MNLQVKREIESITGITVKEMSFDGQLWQGTLVTGVSFQFNPISKNANYSGNLNLFDQGSVDKLF